MEDGRSKGWSDLIQTVADKKYDLFLAGNSLTESRAKIVDHSFPIVPTSVRLIYLRNPNSATSGSWLTSALESFSTNSLIYVQSFLKVSWIAIIFMTVGAFVMYLILQNIAYKVNCIELYKDGVSLIIVQKPLKLIVH